MITIRPYEKSDWAQVDSWWKHSREIGPLETMMPLESSFVACIDRHPALAVAVYLTNCPEIAYVENFIGNPEFKGAERKEAALRLSDHIAEFAAQKGFKRLICMTEKPLLKRRYQDFGFIPTVHDITTFVRRTH